MSSLSISIIVLSCIFGSAILGLLMRPRFPDEHLNAETKDVIKLVMGIVGTMTGMVLGLLVASAKSSFDSEHSGVAQLAANVVVLDRSLTHYGSEAKSIRDALKESVNDMYHQMWPDEAKPANHSTHRSGEEIYDQILDLQPKNDAQRTTQAQALKVIHDTAHMRWLLYSQRSSSIPTALLVLMVVWLAITFTGYGLFAPRHTTSIAVLFLGALVVSSAVFLILELDHAYGGMIHISSEPLHNAMTQLGK